MSRFCSGTRYFDLSLRNCLFCAVTQSLGSSLHGHAYETTNASTVAAAMNGSCDYDCGDFYLKHMGEALDAGSVTRAQVEQAAAQILVQLFLRGEFEPDAAVPARSIGPEVVNSAAHAEVALDTALQAIVLLKSEPAAGRARPLLPIDAATSQSFAFIGPHANSSELLLG